MQQQGARPQKGGHFIFGYIPLIISNLSFYHSGGWEACFTSSETTRKKKDLIYLLHDKPNLNERQLLFPRKTFFLLDETIQFL